jgi:hypothetical protein
MITVSFGTCAVDTAVTSFAPSLAMPSFSYFRPTMKPVMFCRKMRGILRWQHSSMKCAPLSADSLKRMPLFASEPDRHAVQKSEPVTSVRAVARLEFVEGRVVDEPE